MSNQNDNHENWDRWEKTVTREGAVCSYVDCVGDWWQARIVRVNALGNPLTIVSSNSKMDVFPNEFGVTIVMGLHESLCAVLLNDIQRLKDQMDYAQFVVSDTRDMLIRHYDCDEWSTPTKNLVTATTVLQKAINEIHPAIKPKKV